MIQTINLSDFRDAFSRYDRAAQFSYEGLGALFESLEEFAPDFDLDVIALCCDYSEDTVEQIAEAYGLELPPDETEKEHQAAVRAYLEAHTCIVADLNGRFLYAQF
jgi:hypothetical protein